VSIDTPAGAPEQVVTVRRTFDADRKTVFEAWTDPDAIADWFGGATAEILSAVVDLRVGGAWQLTARDRGLMGTVRGIYREVEPPARLVYTWSWDPPAGPGTESLVTVEFREVGDGTEIVITHEGLVTEQGVAFHEQGWTDSLEELARVLA
jgi:uncharacterized protein YndB with AHSA1/START domain